MAKIDFTHTKDSEAPFLFLSPFHFFLFFFFAYKIFRKVGPPDENSWIAPDLQQSHIPAKESVICTPCVKMRRPKSLMHGVLIFISNFSCIKINLNKIIVKTTPTVCSFKSWFLKELGHVWGECLFTKIIWHEILIEFLQKVIKKCTNHFGKDWTINRADISRNFFLFVNIVTIHLCL